MRKGLVCAILSACCFGMLPILGKLGFAQGMDSTQMLQYRFGLGALLLLGWFALTNRDALRISTRGLLKTALLGGVISPVQSTCLMVSLETIPASTSSLILYFYPAVVTVAGALIHRQRIGRRVALSLLLVTAGCALVFLDAFMREAAPVGMLWASGAMIVFSAYILLVQWLMRGERPLSFSLYVIVFAGVAFGLLRGLPAPGELTLAQAGVALALGLVPTVLATTLLYTAIEAVGGAYASIFSTLEPVTTVAAAALLLGEPVFARQLAGAALIVAGIVLPNLALLRRQKRVAPG
ncbi:DMT family transporter [Desulfocurvus sp.]|jgi:drug/metabolite transporter (DMT)-like permease|uniref:DMT family transporter n=1 Tax=Desulfocurvus sp. TaxID=2871698 RepID=UPI0025BDC931|nr:DMT family transporter [Desulfocurvus sp.]MCK9239387.1 DMT family transporter [Desulfocurvus sp.]